MIENSESLWKANSLTKASASQNRKFIWKQSWKVILVIAKLCKPHLKIDIVCGICPFLPPVFRINKPCSCSENSNKKLCNCGTLWELFSLAKGESSEKSSLGAKERKFSNIFVYVNAVAMHGWKNSCDETFTTLSCPRHLLSLFPSDSPVQLLVSAASENTKSNSRASSERGKTEQTIKKIREFKQQIQKTKKCFIGKRNLEVWVWVWF